MALLQIRAKLFGRATLQILRWTYFIFSTNYLNKSLKLTSLEATLTSKPLEEQLMATKLFILRQRRQYCFITAQLGEPLCYFVLLGILPPSRKSISFILEEVKLSCALLELCPPTIMEVDLFNGC